MNVGASAVGGVYVAWLVAYLVTEIGVDSFGVWASVTAVLAPLAVLDVGLSLVVVRAAAQQGAGDSGARRDARAATGLYAIVGLVALVVGAGLGYVPERVLGLSGDAALQARIVTWVLAADYAVVLMTAAWGAVLRGGRRYGAVLASAVVQATVGILATIAALSWWGIVGAALAQLVAHASGRAVHLLMVRRTAAWYSPIPGKPEFPFLRRVLKFGAPLLLISIAAQISFSTDVLVVGAVAGAAAASWVAVGSRLPSLTLALVQIGVDVLFPVFVHEASGLSASHSAKVRSGIRVAAFAGAVTFLAMLLARDAILSLWIGEVDHLALDVFAVYCVAWIVHMPAHVVALVMIARGRHGTLAMVVVAEAVMNLALSVILVLTVGPIGAALASLSAVALSNLVFVPLLARRTVGLRLQAAVQDAAVGTGAGLAVAVAAYAITSGAGLPTGIALMTQIVVTGIASAGVARALWRWNGERLESTA